MSIRVADPAGVVWDVEREWFRRPEWSQSSPDPRLEWGGLSADSRWGTVLVFFGSLLVVLVFLLVAIGVLGARLLSISPWTVTARSSQARLEWRVRGTLRSARAVREIAVALERGDEWPLIDGSRPDVVEASPV